MGLKKFVPFLSTTLVVLLIDQLSKRWVLNSLTVRDSICLIDGYLCIILRFNQYNVFGIKLLPPKIMPFFIVFASLLLIYFALKEKKWIYQMLYGFILGGALGNLFDRLTLGKVIDFIDIGVTPRLRWPTFNLADAAIDIGIFGLIVLALIESRHKGDM